MVGLKTAPICSHFRVYCLKFVLWFPIDLTSVHVCRDWRKTFWICALFFIFYVLGVFGNSTSEVVAITAGSWPTNKCVTKMLDVGRFKFVSHRYSLAVQVAVSKPPKVFDRVRSIKCKHCLPTRPAKVRQFMELRPLWCNETRWTSVNKFFSWYTQIRDYLKQLDMPESDNWF